MHSNRICQFRSLVLVSMILALGLIAGCPKGNSGSTDQSSGSAAKTGDQPAQVVTALGADKLIELSEFNGGPYINFPPDALFMNTTGTAIYTHARAGNGYEFIRFPIVGGKLGKHELLWSDLEFKRAFVTGHPTEKECLMIDVYQADGGPVVDVIWRGFNRHKNGIPYNGNPDIPDAATAAPNTYYGLNPIYSWDGSLVIVPFNSKGLCIVDRKTGLSDYVEYPEMDFTYSSMTVKPLPDADGRRYIYASFWYPGWPEDACTVGVLDLDTHEWIQTIDADWIINSLGTSDPLNLPWLAVGSTPPSMSGQVKREPRLAMIDPYSGVQQPLPFWGEPVWEVKQDPFGEYVVYMDTKEQGVVRLNVESGELDIDHRWFTKENEPDVFVGPHGEPVAIWSGKVLLFAKWDESKQYEGLDGQ